MTRSEWKAAARARLGGGIFKDQWLMGVVFCLVVSAIVGAAGSILPGVGALVVTGPMLYAQKYAFLAQAREGRGIDLNDLFRGFRDDFGGTLLISLLSGLFIFLWSLLLFIPGIVKAYAYSMVYYVKADHPEYGSRKIPFTKELWIEKGDFMVEPIKKYKRLYPGNEVRLYKGYYVTCTGYDTDENGEVTCVHCTYDPESFGGDTPDGRKVRGTIHWVSAADNVKATVRMYDRLFDVENPSDEEGVSSFEDNLNPDSLVEVEAYCEKSLADTKPGDKYQFMRIGFFCTDKDTTDGKIVFNKTVAMRDTFNKKK